MPVCCVVMAHFPKAHLIFSVPVLSLITAGALTLVLLYGGTDVTAARFHQPTSGHFESQGLDARATTNL
jgi:hypothetical protein